MMQGLSEQPLSDLRWRRLGFLQVTKIGRRVRFLSQFCQQALVACPSDCLGSKRVRLRSRGCFLWGLERIKAKT